MVIYSRRRCRILMAGFFQDVAYDKEVGRRWELARWEVGPIAEDCLELKSIEALRATKRCAMRGIGHLEGCAMMLVGSI